MELEFEITSMHRGEWVGANVQIGHKQGCTYFLGKVVRMCLKWVRLLTCLQLCSQHSLTNSMRPSPWSAAFLRRRAIYYFQLFLWLKLKEGGSSFVWMAYTSVPMCAAVPLWHLNVKFTVSQCKLISLVGGICQLETYWWNECALMSERLVNAERRSGVWQCHFLRQMSTHSSQVAFSAASIQKKELSCQVKVPLAY